MKNEVLPGLIDPDRIADVFVEGVAAIETIGAACLRWTLYTTRHFGTEVEHVVVARIVIPSAVAANAMRQTDAVLSGQPFVNAVPLSEFLS